MRFKKIIDLFDLQNDLGGQSRKSKLFLEKLVNKSLLIHICRRMSGNTSYAYLLQKDRKSE